MVDEAFMSNSGSHLTSGRVSAYIGEQVTSWRNETGLSEADLASVLHLSVDAIRSAEKGDERFTAEQIVTICQTFKVKPSRFLQNAV